MQGITDIDIATLYFNVFPDKHIYDQDQDCFYTLNEFNIWIQDSKFCDVSANINNYIPNKLIIAYKKKTKWYIEHEHELNKQQSSMYDFLKKTHSKNMKYLGMNKSKKGIINELMIFYQQKNIYEKLDNVNNHLFAFDNGVYDLKINEFRLPKPEELITITCGYNYENITKEMKEDIKFLMEIIESMFSSEVVKDYSLLTIAQCLAGEGSMEKFYLWKGSGRNGKGTLRDIIMYTFGRYFDTLEIDYLNKTKQGQHANAADDIMARKKNVRLVMTTEPDSQINLKTNKLRQWSGKDPIQCRALYGKSFNYVPKFKLFIQSNYEISFEGAKGKHLTERLEVLEFSYCFVKNPIQENEKPMDGEIKNKLKDPKYKIAFFHLLLKYYNKFQEINSIELPTEIREQTDLYLIDNDPFGPFYNDIIEKVSNSTIYVKSSDLFNAFKKYYQGNPKMNTKEFKATLIDKGLKPTILKGYVIWRGIKINELKLNETKEEINFDEIEFLEDGE